MTELTSAQLGTIIGGVAAGPPPAGSDPSTLPYHLRPSASISGIPKWAAALHDQAAKAFGSMSA